MNRSNRRRIEKEKDILNRLGVKVFDVTTPILNKPPTATGKSIQKCYASKLGSCDGPISREHFISKNILAKIGEIDPAGIPWLAHLDKKIDPDYLTSNCLCRRHNMFLSPLDQFAGEAFDRLSALGKTTKEASIIWGPSLERWFLKVLMGLIGTKKLNDDDGPIGIDDIPSEWVDYLFGLRDFPYGIGLFAASYVGQELRNGLAFQMLNLGGKLVGMKVSFGAIEFYFSMKTKEESFLRSHPNYNNILYHPNEYIWENANLVRFHW